MKLNTGSSSAPSALLPLIWFWAPVPVGMMQHRFGQQEVVVALQQQMQELNAAVARYLWGVWHAQSRAISSIIGVQLNASRNEASQGAASLDASPHTLAVRRHAMKRAPFCQIGQSQFIL